MPRVQSAPARRTMEDAHVGRRRQPPQRAASGVDRPCGILQGVKVKAPRQGMLWAGPEADGPNGGITQSMLSKFLVCRERFRLRFCEGLREGDRFSHRLEYGQMWHACEESLAAKRPWEDALLVYGQGLLERYPMDREQIEHWWMVCKTQFPHYVKHWALQPDVQRRTPVFQEQVFDVRHRLPSGRIVRLRGKWDAVDLIAEDANLGLWIQENKTKADIDRQALERQLTLDLQSMFYAVALEECGVGMVQGQLKVNAFRPTPTSPIKLLKVKGGPVHLLGIRYNTVRRPLSGGKGSIVRGEATQGSKCPKCRNEDRLGGRTMVVDRKSKEWMVCPKCDGVGRVGAKPAETKEAFYGRLDKVIEADPGSFFERWKVKVTERDVDFFKRRSLDPILEQLCDWYDAQRRSAKDGSNFLMPYGVYSPLLDGGETELDNYIRTGSTAGLRRTDQLFEELSDANR